MSALKKPRAACLTSLQITIDNELQGGELHLYSSNHTPADTDTESTYSAIEPSNAGLEGQTVSDWGDAALVSNVATTEAGLYTFTVTAGSLPVTIYGVYYLDVNGDFSWAELFDDPVTLENNGESVSFVPRYNRKGGF